MPLDTADVIRRFCHGSCAVKGDVLQRVKVPARGIGLFHPVAVETDEEAEGDQGGSLKNRLKLSMSKGRSRRFSKQAGRNVSER